MLRPATARLFTTMLLWNSESNSVAQPTGQVELGLAIVESPAIQTVVGAAAAAPAGAAAVAGRTLQAAEAALGAASGTGRARARTINRRTGRMVPPAGDGRSQRAARKAFEQA